MKQSAIFLVRLLSLAFVLLTTMLMATVVQAQVEARVASITGGALRLNNQQNYKLAKGDVLVPGDEINTLGGGRVVVQLSDGSIITVQPNSRILMKDYRAATSMRDLFQIVIGRVRVKIHHAAGKPNPYRVNSPSASILVRGTEYGVTVDAAGETHVAVYEGLVEVISLANARKNALVNPGRGVIVTINGDLRFFTPGANSEISERGNQGNRDDNHRNNSGRPAPGSTATNHNGDLRRNIAGDYERYLDSLVEPGEAPPFVRFLAFPDSHFDSLENPAYATEFSQWEGRATLLPSWSRAPGRRESSLIFSNSPIEAADRGALFQTSFFAPLPSHDARNQTVIGGSVATADSNLHTFSNEQFAGAITPAYPNGIPTTQVGASGTDSATLSGSVLVARQFGSSGRTSIGLGVDHVSGNSLLQSMTSLTTVPGAKSAEELTSRAWVDRTRFRFGLTRDFGATNKLGIFYRHGITEAEDRDRLRTFNGAPLPLDSVRFKAQSSEIGARLRGLVTRKLFYGVESTFLQVRLNESINRFVIVPATERERINRAAISFGLGYAIRRRTVFGLDVGGGVIRISDRLMEVATGNKIEDKQQHIRFTSLHASMQTDVWRQLFFNVSALTTIQYRTIDKQLFPDRFGRRLNSAGIFVPDGRTQDRLTSHFTDVGVGWRFKSNFLLEYVWSKSSGQATPNHVILLRYTFKREQ